MTHRTARCRCGQFTAACEGEPVRVSVCHCHACQRRSGSAFAAQARWPEDRVRLNGIRKAWQRTGDAGSIVTYLFCPDCGTTLAYTLDTQPGLVALPMGGFAGQDLPAPGFSVHEDRKLPWTVILGDDVEHIG